MIKVEQSFTPGHELTRAGNDGMVESQEFLDLRDATTDRVEERFLYPAGAVSKVIDSAKVEKVATSPEMHNTYIAS